VALTLVTFTEPSVVAHSLTANNPGFDKEQSLQQLFGLERL